MKIPQNKWIQLNEGDKSGNIFVSWNLDIGDTIKPSPRTTYTFDENEAGLDLGLITGFLNSDADGSSKWWVMSDGGRLLKAGTTSSASFWETEPDETLDYDGQTANFTIGDTLTGGTSGATATIVTDDDNGSTGTLGLINLSGNFQDNETITDDSGGSATANGTETATNAPENCQDIEGFRGDIIVAEQNDLSKLESDTGNWDSSFWQSTLSQSALDSSFPVVLHNPDFINTWLLVGNGNKLHVIDSNNNVLGSGEGRIVLPPRHTIEWIESSSNSFWIGTSNNQNGEAKIFQWNGKDSVPSNAYGAKSEKTYSGVVLNDVPYTLNNKGQLLGYSGGSFEEVGRLDIANEPYYQNDTSNTLTKTMRLADDAVDKNGMSIIEDQIHLFTTGETTSGARRSLKTVPAGIYAFDEEHGLHHRYGIGQTKSGGNILDYGAPIISSAGAITQLNSVQRTLLYGATVFTDQLSTLNTLGDLTVSSNRRGYLVTTRLLASEVQNNFNKLWVIFERMRQSGEEIIVKYRTEKDPTYPIQDIPGLTEITWSDTDTFTTTNSAYSDVEKGNEILILNGRGAGTTVHVDSISESGGTYTVNLDETIANVSGTALARVMNWNKIGKITSTTRQSQSFGIPNGTAEWVQFKIEFRGTGYSYDSPRLDKLEIEFNTGQNA